MANTINPNEIIPTPANGLLKDLIWGVKKIVDADAAGGGSSDFSTAEITIVNNTDYTCFISEYFEIVQVPSPAPEGTRIIQQSTETTELGGGATTVNSVYLNPQIAYSIFNLSASDADVEITGGELLLTADNNRYISITSPHVSVIINPSGK